MGLFDHKTSAPPPPLAGLGVALGLFPQYTQHQTECTVKLREKKFTFSGDDFAIKTVDGYHILSISGKVFSIRDKKILYDANGAPLLNIQNKLLSIHREFKIFPGETEDQEMMHVRGHFSFGGAKMTATFTNFDGRPIELQVTGDFWDRKAEICYNNVPIARINRQFLNAGQLLFDQQTYFLTAAPGVDLAMLVALCVCLDEKENENKKSGIF